MGDIEEESVDSDELIDKIGVIDSDSEEEDDI